MKRFDRSITSAVFLWFFFFAIPLLSFNAFAYDGDDLGYIDAVTVNDRHFEDLDENEIVFYKEDLIDGEVIIRGLLEQEKDESPVETLAVEVTFDGGTTWLKTKGNASWTARFRPELERGYEFGVRVVHKKAVKETPTDSEEIFQIAIGDFTLIAKARLVNGSLSGEGVINLGFLNHYLPESILSQNNLSDITLPNPPTGTNDLNPLKGIPVSFAGLKLDRNKIKAIAGEITKDISLELDLIGSSVLTIRSIKLSPQGASFSGRLAYSGDLQLPVVPINDLGFSLAGIKDTLDYRPRRPLSIPIISGQYGAALRLKSAVLDIDTSKMDINIKDIDIGLKLSESFGTIQEQKIALQNKAWQWGSSIADNAVATLTIPGTGIKIKDIGGTIEKGFGGITLNGKISIPSYGQNTLDLDLEKLSGLKINQMGISTLKKIVIKDFDKKFAIDGFEAGAKSFMLDIRNNVISGAMAGEMKLAKLSDAKLSFNADIGSGGLKNLKADISGKAKTLSIPSFADITLSGAEIKYSGRGGLSVSLDGSVALTNPALTSLSQNVSAMNFGKEKTYYSDLGKTTISKNLGAVNGKVNSALKRGVKKGKQIVSQGADFVFNQLELSKNYIKLPDNLKGWHTLATPLSANIESVKLSAESWGLGTDSKGLWAGIKGSVNAGSGATSANGAATVQFYSDGSYNILDFQANTTITIGDFVLYTDATLSGGMISGSGRLVSSYPMPSLPDAVKDASDNLSLDVLFSELEINQADLKVLAGTIEVPVDFTIPFEMADISFSRLTFSPQSALADAKVKLKGMPGIEGFSISDVSITGDGFGASASYTPRNPLTYTFFDEPYDLTAVFKGINFSFSTAGMSFNITNLDAYIETGEGFDSNRFDLGVKENLFAWGSALKESAEGEVQAAMMEIPGGLFAIENPGGFLSLADNLSFDITGKIIIPGFDDFSITIPTESPLSISKEGISTTADIVLDQLAKKISIEGFPAVVKNFSLKIAKNSVDASFASDINLEKFGDIKIGIKGVLGNRGITSLSLESELPSAKASIDGFADIELRNISAGYGEKGFSFTFDSDIQITNSAIAGYTDSAQSALSQGEAAIDNAKDQLSDEAVAAQAKIKKIVLSNISIYKDFIDLPDDLKGWHALTPPATASIEGVNLALMEWGVGTEGDKLWVGLKGSADGSADGASGEAGAIADAAITAQFFTDGTFRVLDFDFAGVFTFGPFKLMTDASVTNGRLSGSGNLITETPLSDEAISYLPSAFIDQQKKTLNAVVSFQDLMVSEAENMISSGMIAIEQNFDINVKDVLTMDISKLGFSTDGISLDGVMDLPKVGSMVSVPGFEFNNLKLGLNGFSGISTLSTNWGTPFEVSIIDNLGIKLKLNSLGIKIDWDNPGLSMLSFNTISGHLDFGTLFQETEALRNQAMQFVDNALKIDIPEVKIPNTDISLKSLAAKIDMSDSLPQISFDTAELNLPFYDEILKVAGSGLKIDTSGLSGTFAMSNITGMKLDSFGFNANLKSLSVEFDNTLINAGSFDLGLKVDKFFALVFDVSGRIDMDGIKDFCLGVNVSDIPKVNAYDIADISLNSLDVGYIDGEGVFLNLEPAIDIKYDVLKSLNEFTMKDVKVFKDRISASGASISQSLEDLDFELGPAEVGLTKVGLALSDDDLAFTIGGKIKLADLCTAGADITLNKSGVSLDGIELDYTKPGVKLGGLLEWSEGKFRSAVNLGVAEIFNFGGDIAIGREKTEEVSFSYWRVEINAPAAIPLAPLPVSIYKIGGGLAYHMKASPGEKVTSPIVFKPDVNTNFTLIANTQMGTTADNGYSWHGDFRLVVDPGNFYILFKGDSYVMATRQESPSTRKLSVEIEMGASPALFHLSATANFQKKKGSLELFKVAGEVDILFSENDWHIHVGTKENKMSVSAINHIFSGEGYVMIDSSGLMLGVKKEFSVEDSIACFYGKLYGGASLDLIASVRPFFIDAEGKIWVGIEAGVKAFGEKYEIFDAYGSLAMKIRCPDPTYVKVKAKFKYSFLGGWVSGTYKMTFWMPDKPEEAKSGKISFPLISFLSPENNGNSISRISKMELNTTLPIDEVVRLDNGKKYVLRIVDSVEPEATTIGPVTLYKYINVHDSAKVYNAISVKDTNGTPLSRVVGGVLDVDTIKVQSFNQLKRNHTYKIKAQAHLIQLNDKANPGKVDFSKTEFSTLFANLEYKEPAIINTFKTADTDDLASAREIIEGVYPNYSTAVVYPDTEVRVTYRVPSGGQTISLTNKHYVLDPLKRVVVSPAQWKQGLGTVDDIMATEQWVKFVKPQTLLKPVVVWVDTETGEKREPVIVNGHSRNPFTYSESTATTTPYVEPVEKPRGITNSTAYQSNTEYSVNTNNYQQQSGATYLADESVDGRYQQKELGTYYIQIKDPDDDKIVFQNKFEITSQSSGGGNSQIIGSNAQNNSTEGNDPFNIVMMINKIYGEDTQALEDYDQRHEAFKEELFARFMRSEFGAGGQDCAPGGIMGGALPAASAHYYDEDSEDHREPKQNCYTGGCGYGGTCEHCYPAGYTYDYGYEPPPASHLPSFWEMTQCQIFLREYELWKMNNPRPRDYHAYGAPEDILFYFDTESPLNWDALDMKFEINMGKIYIEEKYKHHYLYATLLQNYSAGFTSLGSYSLNRNDYSVLSQPESLNHVIRIPISTLMAQETINAYTFALMMTWQMSQGTANASLWAVESYQASGGAISTRASNKLNTWNFQLKEGTIGEGYPCQSCQYYGYGASHCTDMTCYTSTDIHFVLTGSQQ